MDRITPLFKSLIDTIKGENKELKKLLIKLYKTNLKTEISKREQTSSVKVENLPETQKVEGKVDIDFPETQKVEVTNQVTIPEYPKIPDVQKVQVTNPVKIPEQQKIDLSKVEQKLDDARDLLEDAVRGINKQKFNIPKPLPVKVINQQTVAPVSGGYNKNIETILKSIDKQQTLATSVVANPLRFDSFGRARVSEPFTIFDSKQLHDSAPLFWDDQEVSGAGTSTTHNTNKASTSISVSATTAGKRVRQTFQRFNYQPGKSQLIKMTGNLSAGGSGITASVGYFDDNNGVFFSAIDGVINVVRRTYTSGSPVDEAVPQSNWNVDKMDGTGVSKINIDPTKVQIMWIDFEWLGVGSVRMGFVVNGIFYHCHTFNHANIIDSVYMSTPNLPIRYEIENDGTGSSATLMHICSSVESEGGQEKLGILRHTDSGSVSSLSAGTKYAVLGLRLKSTHIDVSVLLENLSCVATSVNDQAHWELIFNPTVAGTFTYSDQTNSAVQVATGANTNIVTGGYEIDGGYFATALPVSPTTPNALRLGANISGSVDEIVLAVRPITNNITVEGSLTWRELL